MWVDITWCSHVILAWRYYLDLPKIILTCFREITYFDSFWDIVWLLWGSLQNPSILSTLHTSYWLIIIRSLGWNPDVWCVLLPPLSLGYSFPRPFEDVDLVSWRFTSSAKAAQIYEPWGQVCCHHWRKPAPHTLWEFNIAMQNHYV